MDFRKSYFYKIDCGVIYKVVTNAAAFPFCIPLRQAHWQSAKTM